MADMTATNPFDKVGRCGIKDCISSYIYLYKRFRYRNVSIKSKITECRPNLLQLPEIVGKSCVHNQCFISDSFRMA